MRVSELMNKNVISVTAEENAAEASRLLTRHNIGSLPVVGQDGKLRGIVTDRDIVTRCIAADSDPAQTHVKEIMTRAVVTVPSGADIREAGSLMAARQIRRLPVVEDGRLVGMLSLGDMARSRTYDMEASHALSEISETKTKTEGRDS